MSRSRVSLKHHFLIAMPDMADPNFAQTVVYLAEHSEEGAMGVIINRPTEITLGTLYERIDLSPPVPAMRPAGLLRRPSGYRARVRAAPPGRKLARHHGAAAWSRAHQFPRRAARRSAKARIRTTSSSSWARRLGPGSARTGTRAKRLAHVPADPELIFGVAPEQRYEAALALLGVALHHLVIHAGHG